jgi:hypothetical protein
MIQFNLLTDVKLEYIKSKQLQRTVMLIATIITASAVGLLILLILIVYGLQKKHISDQTVDIKKYSQELQNTQDLNKKLTVQNQLDSLPGLHNDKVVATRLFSYLGQLTPAQASITKFDIDYAANTMIFTGTADSLSTVNKFADTLKFTTYKTEANTTDKPAFSKVVLNTFARTDKDASYQIDATFDTAIFNSTNDVTLTVPKIISTRSETEKPEALFQGTNR